MVVNMEMIVLNDFDYKDYVGVVVDLKELVKVVVWVIIIVNIDEMYLIVEIENSKVNKKWK